MPAYDRASKSVLVGVSYDLLTVSQGSSCTSDCSVFGSVASESLADGSEDSAFGGESSLRDGALSLHRPSVKGLDCFLGGKNEGVEGEFNGEFAAA